MGLLVVGGGTAGRGADGRVDHVRVDFGGGRRPRRCVIVGTGPVGDDTRARARRHWADHEVVELTMVIGATLLLNRFATALALPTGSDTLTRLASEGFA